MILFLVVQARTFIQPPLPPTLTFVELAHFQFISRQNYAISFSDASFCLPYGYK
jgi:hypothetical protein